MVVCSSTCREPEQALHIYGVKPRVMIRDGEMTSRSSEGLDLMQLSSVWVPAPLLQAIDYPDAEILFAFSC